MSQASNWFIRRLEKDVVRREKRIAKFRSKMEGWLAKYDAGKIHRAKLETKKVELESKIRVQSAKIHTNRGKIGVERRRIDKEKAEGG